jgi:murein DD-endopeptidase MepM/ murein hydrolase activator NlpD
MRWITHDLSRYVGHRVHLQFSPKAGEGFRVLAVVEGDRPPAPKVRPNRLVTEALAAADDAAKAAALAKLVESTLDLAAAGTLADDAQPRDRAALAHWLARQELTKEEPAASLAEIRQQASDERAKLAARLDNPSRVAIAMWDGTAVDENLLIRGNHRTVGDVVPRRMLAAICGDEAESSPESESAHDKQPGSGRLELARQLVDPANPFTSRVMVNRIWQHLLGRGIVPSVDNFGVLGQEPTHPELLDHLAQQFIREGWSVKRLIRTIVLSDTYQQASGGTDAAIVAADEADPQNLLFHRQNLRRLEGEAIRDAILTISGRLDRTQFGPSVPVHLTSFMQGRGRPGGSGPLDGAGRRSIYQAVRRNFLPPMMLAFDTPIPFSTVGRRNVSNVPAQALILMNDPFVVEEAKRWAKRIVADRDGSPETRIRQMYLEAFSREPTAAETAAAREFLSLQAAEYGLAVDAAMHDERVWGDLAHVLFNVKEFVLLN